MVIVRLLGGLGNQCFQYATGRAIADWHQVPLKLDISFFDRYPNREYRLHHFNISADLASRAEMERMTGKGKNRLIRWVDAIWQKRLPYYRRLVYEQQGQCYDPHIKDAGDDVYLAGYWQSEKFFIDIEGIIRQELAVKKPPDELNRSVCKHIEKTESVSLHIRRGDYASDPKVNQVHGLCSLEYYEAAIKTLTQTVKKPSFFVFSDDITWARNNLDLDIATTYVDHNGNAKDFEDLRLMRHCKHHIIANSSFSWWGAWLCDHPQKIVIAPKRWFKIPLGTIDLIPDSWLRL